MHIHFYGRYVSLECNVAARKCKRLKNLLIKGCGSRFHHESLSLNVKDKDLGSKRLPQPLIGELFNHSHVATLHLRGTVRGSSGKRQSFFRQFCNSGLSPNFFTAKVFFAIQYNQAQKSL